MFTLAQLKDALPALQSTLQTMEGFHSVSIKPVCAAHVYYTDGEAGKAVATFEFGYTTPVHESSCLEKSSMKYTTLYVCPDGRMMSHFMNRDGPHAYVTCVKEWLATLV